MKIIVALVLFSGVLPVWAQATYPASISVNVSAAAISAAPKLYSTTLSGANTPWPGQGEAIYANGAVEPRLFALAQGLGNQVLRYPGGEFSDSYIWTKGIGPRAQRQNLTYYPSASSNQTVSERVDFGTDEFLDYCFSLGCTPIFQINMHSTASAVGVAATANEIATNAANWQAYVLDYAASKGRSNQAIYWELGNEPYLKNMYHEGGVSNHLFISDAEFVSRVNKVIERMAPQTKFILPFALDTWNGNTYSQASASANPATVVGDHISIPSTGKVGYWKTVLDGISYANRSKIHALGLHYYMPNIGVVASESAAPPDDKLFWATMAGAKSISTINIPAIRAQWNAHSIAKNFPLRLAVTEFNSMYTLNYPGVRQNAFVASQTGAVFISDLLTELAKQPDVTLGAIWSMSTNGYFGAISFADLPPSYPTFVRPSYFSLTWVRDLLSDAASKLIVPTVSVQSYGGYTSPVGFSMPSSISLMNAVASVSPGKILRVLITNREISVPGNVTLFLSGGNAASASLKKMQVAANGQFLTSEISAVTTSPPAQPISTTNPQQLSFTVPAYSTALLTIQLQ